MSEFRKLQAKLEKIEESYHSRLAAAIDDMVTANPGVDPVILVNMARSQFGDAAAKYLSDQLESEGDFLDYSPQAKAADKPIRKHMKKQDEYGRDFDSWLDKNPFESIEEEAGGDDFWAETAKQDAKVAEFAINEFGGLGFKRHPNWPAGTTLVANGDLRKQVRTKFKAEGWTKEEPENRISWWKHPSLPYISVAEHDRIRTTVTSMLPYGAKIEEDLHPEDSINDQIRSLLKLGKKVMSRVGGAIGEITDIGDDGISLVQHPAETRRGTSAANFNTFSNLEVIGQIDHFDIVQRWDDSEIDEGVGDWLKRLDKKAASWIDQKAARLVAKKVAAAAAEDDIQDIAFDLSYGSEKKLVPALEKYLEYEPEGEYAETIRYILPAQAKERGKWDDIMQQAEKHLGIPVDEEAELDEARGRVVKVPPELRGNTEMTGNATSADVKRFLADLGPDDDVSHDVVDPETGELLDWPTKGLNRDEREDREDAADWRYRGGTKRERGMAKYKAGQKEEYDDVPNLLLYSGTSFGSDIDHAHEFMNDLRNSDFYNVVWRNVGEGFDDEEMRTAAQGDYDVDYDVPVALKRKDGAKLIGDDHDNIKEIIKAVKAASTMQNVGIGYAGTSDNGTTARFYPMFM